jgi:hypothetical protein
MSRRTRSHVGRFICSEQLQQIHRSTARYAAVPPEGFEPTVLESRSPFELGAHAWDSTFLRECFTACPPEVWDVSTNREGL